MAKPGIRKTSAPKRTIASGQADLEALGKIIDTLRNLRDVAAKVQSQDIHSIIDSTFRMCYALYMTFSKESRSIVKAEIADQEIENKNLLGIVGALEYLREEADRHKMEDVGYIIDAAFRLCVSRLFLELRGEYPFKDA